jgi:ankyrin repeat protein
MADLLTKDTKGQTAWHLSAANGKANGLSTLWEWAKKVHLNPNDLENNWLVSQDSAWHLAARSGHINVLKKLWYWAREMHLNLLPVNDVAGRTAVHVAAEQGNTGAVEEILDLAKEAKLNSAADLLLAKDRNEQTALDILKDCHFISEQMKAQVLQRWSRYLTDA